MGRFKIFRPDRFLWLLLIVTLMCMIPMAPIFFARVDAGRDAKGKQPLFCWSSWIGKIKVKGDGGTEIFEGFGYEFTRKHKIIPKIYAPGATIEFETGVIVRYRLPGYQRFDFETTTNPSPP